MGNQYKSEVEELAKKSSLQPQEALMKRKTGKHSLFIGIPKEIAMVENRVALTPEAVALLVNNDHQVWVESNAGRTSKFTDREYSDVGAKIVYSAKEVFEADIVLKVEPPTYEEIEYFKPGKTLISALQIGSK